MRICLDGKTIRGRSVLALGMFDGVHLGHRALLQSAKALAVRHGVPLAACTFTTHPMALIAPEKAPPMLTTLDERARRMASHGVNLLCAQPFDRRLMNQDPETYIAALCERFHPLCVVVGYNFTFGRAGKGNPGLLAALGRKYAFSVWTVPKVTLDGQEVSSTVIRGLLGRGEAARARLLLGYPYTRQAAAAGKEGGETLLAMEPNGKQDLPRGAYRVLVDCGGRSLPASVFVKGDGMARAPLPGALPFATGLRLRFFAEEKPKKEKGNPGKSAGREKTVAWLPGL